MSKPVRPRGVELRGGVPVAVWLPTSARDVLGHRKVEVHRELTPEEAGRTYSGHHQRRGWRVTLHGGPDGAEHGDLTTGPMGDLFQPIQDGT